MDADRRFRIGQLLGEPGQLQAGQHIFPGREIRAHLQPGRGPKHKQELQPLQQLRLPHIRLDHRPRRSILMTGYLASYFGAIVTGLPALVWVGSILQGISNGGGQLTWSLASSHFAPRAEDVPFYGGIHFVLNGVRGLIMPWVGSVLLVVTGPLAVLAATLVSLCSIPVILRSLTLGDSAPPESINPVARETEAS